MINTKELCKKYASDYGVSERYSKIIIDSVFKLLNKIVFANGEDVSIRNFGSFKHRTMLEKNVRHPGTGKIITMPAKDVVRFVPSENSVSLAKNENE